MLKLNSLVFVASVVNNTGNAILIALLATAGFTIFSMIISSIYKKNFVEPDLLGKIIGYHLKDSPRWLNLTLGTIAHFLTGYLFVEIHLFLYQIYTPVWYNALFFGLINGLLGAAIWYLIIRLYRKVLQVNLSEYLTQLILGHVVFALIVLFMYAPPHLGI